MKKIIVILSLFVFLTCRDKQGTNPDFNLFKVSGTVIKKDRPVENATISLNDLINYTTQTDNNGFFQIDNVPKSSYNLKIQKTYENGSYLSKSSTIDVNNDIYLDELRLPDGAILYEAKNITSSEALISWSPTDANDFREYKLFRNTSSGIDENNGDLIHVSTSIIDTIFNDSELESLTEYYYRVYIMNEYGKLGGSNIISLSTQNINLIQNGGFEEIGDDSLPVIWDLGNNKDILTIITGDQAYSGNNCLLINPMEYVYDAGWGTLQYRVPYTKLKSGSEYTLSFWYFIEELAGNSELFIEFNPEQTLFIWDGITGEQEGEWKEYTRTFTAPSIISNDFFLRFEVRVNIPYNNEPWKVRIDDVSLYKKAG